MKKFNIEYTHKTSQNNQNVLIMVIKIFPSVQNGDQ